MGKRGPPPGTPKTSGSGRKKGTPNRSTARTRAFADAAIAEGVTPLEFLLAVMRDTSEHQDGRVQAGREVMRFEAAKAAAPYIHPRLQAIEHSGELLVRTLAQELAELNDTHTAGRPSVA